MKTIIILLMLLGSMSSQAQKYFTRSGTIRFFSSTPLENIEAINRQASCIVDLGNGELLAKVLIEAFQFEKALMQEHFNENYMESDRYPSAQFKATLANTAAFDPNSTATQKVLLTGDLTLHNVTKKIEVPGTVISKGDVMEASATFIIKPEDYAIKIPALVRNNIAREIEVSIFFELKELKN